MQIESVGSMQSMATMAKAPEAAEGPGPNRDGDSDDRSGAVKSATAAGVGNLVDVSA